MKASENIVGATLDKLHREEYGRLVTILTGIFGPANLELAEDVLQDAFLEAMDHWKKEGIPSNPPGWLMQVARNKALNVIKREKHKLAYAKHELYLVASGWLTSASLEERFEKNDFRDDLLKMMFVCSNPAISKESQTTLILKTLCGFRIAEIARAYLTGEPTITKRLVRARQVIRELDLSFDMPPEIEWETRLEAIWETLYLLFNEGYSSTDGEESIRLDICAEAIRLCRLISEHPIGQNSQTFSLLALMCLNASRFRGRVSAAGELIPLDQQDRQLWNQPLIQSGIRYLERAAAFGVISTYYIQAAISACHCMSPSYGDTNWEEILALYDLLLQLDRTPVTMLNRMVALSKIKGASEALRELESLSSSGYMDQYAPFFALRAELLMESAQWQAAEASLRQALALTQNKQEHRLLLRKIQACQANS